LQRPFQIQQQDRRILRRSGLDNEQLILPVRGVVIADGPAWQRLLAQQMIRHHPGRGPIQSQ
jgi:hypothetical protein